MAAPVEVLHMERVERHAVGQREDLRFHDVGPRHRDAARDAREQARMVGGVHGHLGNVAILVLARFDGELVAGRIGARHHLGLEQVRRGVIGEPIGRLAAHEMRRDARLVPTLRLQRLRQFPFRGLDASLAPLGGKSARQHFLGRVVEIAQQRRLPGVPDRGPDGADVGDGQHQQQPQPLDRLHHLDEVVMVLGSLRSRWNAVRLMIR